MNSNAFHNVMNYLLAVVGILALQDWTQFGVDQALALKLVAGFTLAGSLIKVAVNLARDGVSGQFKPQPPVEK